MSYSSFITASETGHRMAVVTDGSAQEAADGTQLRAKPGASPCPTPVRAFLLYTFLWSLKSTGPLAHGPSIVVGRVHVG